MSEISLSMFESSLAISKSSFKSFSRAFKNLSDSYVLFIIYSNKIFLLIDFSSIILIFIFI